MGARCRLERCLSAAEPGCRAVVRRGRCQAHRRPAWGGSGRPSFRARGYDAEYRRNRLIVLVRDLACAIQTHCHGAPSTQADHIDPKGGNGLENLRGACARCNEARGSSLGGRS